jgi:hypothetical protein
MNPTIREEFLLQSKKQTSIPKYKNPKKEVFYER